MTPSIFGSEERTDDAPSKHAESTYTFLCRVAGPVWDQCRTLIDEWLATYPKNDRAALISRLRSSDDRVFTSAFWELYLYEMYRRDGWDIEIEPEVAGVTTRPDFLVSKGDALYYVEARCTFEGGNDRGATARLQHVYDSLNEIDSGAFHLAVTAERIGASSPPTKRLRSALEAWLTQIDPDAGDYSLSDVRPERRHEWIQDDWHLIFHPIPRAAPVRGIRVQRPLGVFIPAGATFVDDISSLRDALQEKGSKYGELEHALLLAINIGSGFHDDRDTEQALYGTVGWQFDFSIPDAEPVPLLTASGYWGWPGQPAHTNVAGVLLAEGMHYGRVGTYAPAFWAHPRTAKTVEPLPVWRVAQATTDGITFSEPTTTPNEHFGLPTGWPVGERFSRGGGNE